MEKWKIQNNIEKIERGENTNFLNQIEVSIITKILDSKKIYYQIFKPFFDAEKQLIYTNNHNVSLFLIKTNEVLTYKKILGTLFHHQLKEDCYGDIIIDNDKYYIMVLDKLKNYMITQFNEIGGSRITLVERNLEEIGGYTLSYKEIHLSVASLRIDNVIAKLIPTSRNNVNRLIDEKKVILNYEILKSKTHKLELNDIFSIRGVGKFKLLSINNNLKSKNIQIIINKYI